MRPYYPVSGLNRLSRQADNLQVDFMTAIDGVNSFEGVRARSSEVSVSGEPLRVAALADVVASKKAANRLSDLAVLGILEKTLDEKNRPSQAPPQPGQGPRRSQKRK